MTEIRSELRHENIATNGIHLHVVQAGPEDGPLVILLHGFPEFWYGWAGQIDALVDAGFRVWVPDQRGYNLSDKPKRVRAYHLDELATDIFGLISAAGVEKAHVVGHDWGAAVVWWMGLLNPEPLDRLVTVNVPHPVVMKRHLLSSFAQLRKSWYMFFFQLPWMPERVMLGNDCAQGKRLLKGASNEGSFDDEDLELYQKAWEQPDAVRSMVNWYRAAFRFLPSPSEMRVTVPMMLIWGTNDIALGEEMAQPSIGLCDQGRLEKIKGASHFVQHDEPERVGALIREFLEE